MEYSSYSVIVSEYDDYIFCNSKITDSEPALDIEGPAMRMEFQSNLPQEEILSCFHYEIIDKENLDFKTNYILALLGKSDSWKLMLVKPFGMDGLWLDFGSKKFYDNQTAKGAYHEESAIFSWSKNRNENDYIKITFILETPDDENAKVSFLFLQSGLCEIQKHTSTEFLKISLTEQVIPKIGRLVHVQKSVH